MRNFQAEVLNKIIDELIIQLRELIELAWMKNKTSYHTLPIFKIANAKKCKTLEK